MLRPLEVSRGPRGNEAIKMQVTKVVGKDKVEKAAEEEETGRNEEETDS